MPLIEIQSDFHEVVVQLKRIADLLEGYLHPPVADRRFDKSRVEITQLNPRGRWEAETEAARQRGDAEGVAGVTPRR